MKDFEYVISGPAYLRLGSEQCNDPAILEMILEMMDKVCNNKNNH
jgi:hypothetical protein